MTLAVFAIQIQFLLLIYGHVLVAFITAAIGALFALGAILAGVDLATVTMAWATVATVLAFNALAFGASAIVGPIAPAIFIIWLVAAFVLEVAILRSLR